MQASGGEQAYMQHPTRYGYFSRKAPHVCRVLASVRGRGAGGKSRKQR